MARFRIEKPRNRSDHMDALAHLCITRIEASERYFQTAKNRSVTYYNLVRGILSGQFHDYRNNVSLPIAISLILADATRKLSAIAAQNPYVRFRPPAAEMLGLARKREALIQMQFERANSLEKWFNMLFAGSIAGASFLRYGWEERTVDTILNDVITESDREFVTARRARVERFKGPDFEHVDFLDMILQPGIPEWWRMRWMGHRYYVDYDDLLTQSGPGKPFNRAAVLDLSENPGPTSEVMEAIRRRRASTIYSEDRLQALLRDDSGSPVEVIDMFGLVPDALAINGVNWLIITLANRHSVLRARELPFWDQNIPILRHTPTPDPYFPIPQGRGERLARIQIAGTRFTNASLDSLELMNDMPFFYDREARLDTRNLYLRPGRFIPVTGPPGERIQPALKDLRASTVGVEAANMLWSWAQRSEGMPESVALGFPGPDREPARGILARSEAASSRLSFELGMFVGQIMEPLAWENVALNRQFSTFPMEATMLGPAASTDPVTGEPLPPERFNISASDLVPDLQPVARGAVSRLTQGERRQEWQVMTTNIGNLPVAAGFPWEVWLSAMAQEYDLQPEVVDAIKRRAGLMQQAAQAQSAQGRGAPGTAPPGLNAGLTPTTLELQGA